MPATPDIPAVAAPAAPFDTADSVPEPPATTLPSHVVGVGASAGGLEALERLFRAMPVDSGMAFVVIQHLSPDFKSLMDELLERFTRMPAIPVAERMRIAPNSIYLLPPKKDMVIEGDELISTERSGDKGLSLPINSFFRSLAAAWGEKAAAIVLSGTGSDGSAGIMDIREGGGLVLVQSEDSARFDGMPRSAITTGCVDAVLAPENMPAALLAYAQNPLDRLPARLSPEATREEGIPAIFERLHAVYDIDFNFYKPQTITRRIERRVALHPEHIGIEEYGRRVQQDATELNLLYKDLLIGVTRFFRDPEAFDVLRAQVIPEIMTRRHAHATEPQEVRVWVCGCSTGEEAYSVAILFLEAFAALGETPQIKILATDLHRESLQFATEGEYPESSFTEMPVALRDKYFIEQHNGSYKVTAELRKALIFSEHNLLRDPPFTRIDLITCRNLLIYFQNTAQLRAIAAFHFALKAEAFLLLGASEGLGELVNEFLTVDRHWKVFAKIRDSRIVNSLRAPLAYHPRGARADGGLGSLALGQGLGELRMGRIYDHLLARYIPAGLLINERFEVAHVFGDAGRYLQLAAGRASTEIFSMVSGNLRIALLTALRGAQQKKETIAYKSIRLDDASLLDLLVEPIVDSSMNATYFMVRLLRQEAIAATTAPPAPLPLEIDQSSLSQMAQLERELLQTRESLQSTVEELETSNEELQATNEELLASNEELLASNEELQSTNEELHSVNEELYSVNVEHELKIQELNAVTGNLNNLILSTELATLFLDDEYAIRLFTPKAREIFPILQQDIGRDLRHFKTIEADATLFDDLAQVLKTRQPLEKSIEWSRQRSFLRRIGTYQDVNKRVAGLVLTYVDISHYRRAEHALHASLEKQNQLAQAVEQSPNGIVITDIDGAIEYVNAAFCLSSGYHRDEVIGRNPRMLQSGQTPLQTYAQLWAALARGEPWRGEFINRRKSGEIYVEDQRFAAIRDDNGQISHYLAIKEDITEKKHLDAELDRYRNRLEDLVDQRAGEIARLNSALEERAAAAEAANRAKSHFLANMSHEIRTPMNAIIGLAHALRRKIDPAAHIDLLDLLDKIGIAAAHLLDVINDILDISKIEADKLLLEHTRFNLDALLMRLCSMVDDRIKAHRLELVVDTDPRLGDLGGDPTRLGQALLNYLGNAIKFTERGRIVLRTRLLDGSEDADGRVLVRFEVADSGIGIAAENLPHLFQIFTQADASTTRRFGGTGLGLAITSRLARLMGGAVGADSTPDVGSTFWMTARLQRYCDTLPAPPALDANPAPAATHDDGLNAGHYRDQRLLLVEDDPVNCEVALLLLADIGCAIDTAANGAEALALAQRNAYDLILMDVQMPVMDGLTATRELRRLPATRATPIIATTANVFSEVRNACQAAGMNDFIPKPLSPDDLYRSLRRWLKPRATPAAVPPAPTFPAAEVGTAVASDPAQSSASADLPEIAELDTATGLRNISGKRAQYLRLLDKLILTHGADAAHFRQLLAAGDFNRLRYSAHGLKGSAAALGAMAVAELAHTIEQSAQAAADTPRVPQPHIVALIDALDAALARLADGLQAFAATRHASPPLHSPAPTP